jgi:uracil phosphoribosyltransferase
MTYILNQQPSIANQLLYELRDKEIQGDPMRFRTNMERLGSILAYEVSKSLAYQEKVVETPLGSTTIPVVQEQPVLITVLRAGIPFFQGFQQLFNRAECGFIGAFREEGDHQIRIQLDYLATPSVDNRVVIIIDPMLATGKSFVKAVDALQRNGRPAYIHIAALVAAPEGIAYIQKHLDLPHSIWTCALDQGLNDDAYIVPGLGDAGDLCYGTKL